MAVDDIRPTHAQLLLLREQIAVATQGMMLLKSKRDALLLEFMEVVDKTLHLSDEMIDSLASAQYSFELARAIDGEANVHSAALASEGDVMLDITGYKVMGVAVPTITQAPRPPRTVLNRGYSPLDVSVRVDEAAQGFEKTISSIMKYAEAETRLRRLGAEISKTNRRTNALEQIRIPELEAQVRLIERALDEQQREELFRLKKVKKKIERNKEMKRLEREAKSS